MSGSLFSNNRLGLAKDFAFLRISGSIDRIRHGKPFHAIDFMIVLRGIATGEARQKERDNFEDSRGWVFPFGDIRIADRVDAGQDVPAQSGFFAGFPDCRMFSTFPALDESLR